MNPRHATRKSRFLPADIPIVAYDYGMKYNILRRLRQHGFRVQVLPATASAAEAREYKPAGVFLSKWSWRSFCAWLRVRAVAELVDTGIPIFGICLGHQILGQAFGGRTFKLSLAIAAPINRSKIWTPAVSRSLLKTTGSLSIRVRCLPILPSDRINLNDQTVEGLRHKK